MSRPNDPVANIPLLCAKVAELVTVTEGRLLLAIILAKAGCTPEKLDFYVKSMRAPIGPPPPRREG
jgi:hypothetical protein